MMPKHRNDNSLENDRKPLLLGLLLCLIAFLGIAVNFYFQHEFSPYDAWINYLCALFFLTSGLTIVAYTQNAVSYLRTLFRVTIIQIFSILALIIFKPTPMTCTLKRGHVLLPQSGLACRIPLGLILLLTMTVAGFAFRQNKEAISIFFERK